MDKQNTDETTNLRKSCIREQCDEVEMLQSIFCNAGEMKIVDHGVLADMFDYLDDKCNSLNRKLDFTITITTNNNKSQAVELQFELPLTYPTEEEPIITVRTKFHATNQNQIENEIKRKIDEYCASDDIDKSTVYIYPIVVWLQENIDDIINSATTTTKQSNNELPNVIEMQRLWIYLHHLKSSIKRQEILKLAKELHLTGFSKPGKPGIICVEGYKENTDEFWKSIRTWPWQKVQLRITELKVKPKSKCEQFRRFDQFKETMCGVTTDASNDSIIPIDMSEFMKFLETHNCGYVKKELLLLE